MLASHMESLFETRWCKSGDPVEEFIYESLFELVHYSWSAYLLVLDACGVEM